MFKVSNSSIRDYLNCRRFYKLRKRDRIFRREVPEALTVGRALHKWMEGLYSGLPDEALDSLLEQEFMSVDTSLFDTEALVKLEIAKHKILAIARAYKEVYADDFEQYKKFLTEKSLEIPLSAQITYEGRLDLLVQDAADDWWILETKTASRGTVKGDFFERVRIDAQILGQVALATAFLGQAPVGVVYNVIEKTSHRQKQTETLGAFIQRITKMYVDNWRVEGLFKREELLIGPNAIEEWFRETLLIAEEMRDAVETAKLWPKNTDYCFNKYGHCPYFPICTTGQVDPLLYVQGS